MPARDATRREPAAPGIPEILGHERPLRALEERRAGGRLAHAYLFSGVAGIGKKRVALELAREFLCPERAAGRGGGSCGCLSCQAARALRHPDLVLIHDVQPIRWEEAARVREMTGEVAVPDAIGELRDASLLLAPIPRGHEARLGFTLDSTLVFRSTTYDPAPLADRLRRMEERGALTTGARRLAAMLYYDDISRLAFRGSLGIHLIARREPLTPERGAVREFLSRTAFHGGGKVVVFDDAHLMTEEAENALLKTLEEPPPRSLIILVTDDPGRLLPTIRSRTQELRFGRLATALIAALVREQGADEPSSLFLAEWADGSAGRALEGELEGLRERRDLAIDLSRAIVEKDLARAMKVAFVLSGGGEDDSDRVRRHRRMARNMELLLLWYRDLAVAAAAGGAAALLLNRDLAPHVRREAAARTAGEWRVAFRLVADALHELGPSSDYLLQAEALVASLALADRSLAGHQAGRGAA